MILIEFFYTFYRLLVKSQHSTHLHDVSNFQRHYWIYFISYFSLTVAGILTNDWSFGLCQQKVRRAQLSSAQGAARGNGTFAHATSRAEVNFCGEQRFKSPNGASSSVADQSYPCGCTGGCRRSPLSAQIKWRSQPDCSSLSLLPLIINFAMRW